MSAHEVIYGASRELTALQFITSVRTVGRMITNHCYGNAVAVVAFEMTNWTIMGATSLGIFILPVGAIKMGIAQLDTIHALFSATGELMRQTFQTLRLVSIDPHRL
jgi:hypothetical protein